MATKICTLGILSLLPNLEAMSQTAIGIQAGPTFSNMVFYHDEDEIHDRHEDHKHRFGFGSGLVADLPLHDHFSLRPELAYRRKGYTQVGANPYSPNYEDEYRWTFDYLDLSLLARYYPRGGARGIHVFLGPSVGRLLGVRVRDPEAGPFDPDIPLNNQSGPVGIIDPQWVDFNVYDLGINGGIGCLFDLGGSWFDVELRYQYGLSNVHNGFKDLDINGALIGEINSANRCFMVNLGWLLPVGKGDPSADPMPTSPLP